MDPRVDPRVGPRMDLRVDARVDLRMDPRMDPRVDPRMDLRVDPQKDPRMDPRMDPRIGPRMDPGMDPRIIWDGRDPQSHPIPPSTIPACSVLRDRSAKLLWQTETVQMFIGVFGGFFCGFLFVWLVFLKIINSLC